MEAKFDKPDRSIASLPSASRKPVFVGPSDSVADALTTMVIRDFSQLPVLDEQDRVLGILRWQTVAKRLLDGDPPTEARRWMTEAQSMRFDRSIYDAISFVHEHEYVLVTDADGCSCGIVTVFDLSEFADRCLMPFMIVEDIEWALRQLKDRCPPVKGPTKTPQVRDDIPSLGTLINTLNTPENWSNLQTKLSRPVVIQALTEVRDMRNRMMHFNVGDALSPEDVQSLKLTARFLRQVGLSGPIQPEDPKSKALS